MFHLRVFTIFATFHSVPSQLTQLKRSPTYLVGGPTTSLSKMFQPHLLSPPYTGCHSFLRSSTLQPQRFILETALHVPQQQRLHYNPVLWIGLMKLSRWLLHNQSWRRKLRRKDIAKSPVLIKGDNVPKMTIDRKTLI